MEGTLQSSLPVPAGDVRNVSHFTAADRHQRSLVSDSWWAHQALVRVWHICLPVVPYTVCSTEFE